MTTQSFIPQNEDICQIITLTYLQSHHLLLIQLTLQLLMISCIPFVTVILCFIGWVSWIFISDKKRVDQPLPPGPMGLPVVGSLPFLKLDLHFYLTELSKTYGPLYSLRLGKKLGIVVCSPSMAKEVLKDQDVIFANHDVPAAAREYTYGGFNIVWTSYGPEWRMLRKVCVHNMVSSATLDSVYNLRKHEIHQTMLCLNERAGFVVNIGDQMFTTAMNMVTNMLWGGTLMGEEREKLGVSFRLVISEITELLGLPNVSDFFPRLARFDFQGIVRKMKICAKKLDDILEDAIDRRRKMEKVEHGKDFLQVLLELKDTTSDSKMPFTMIHLKSLLVDMVLGGMDTTSNTLEFAMAEIVNNRKVMRRAQEELDTILRSSNATLEESHVLQLPYLQAIMKETLRLHPIVPLLVPHCPSESCTVGGYTIPKDSKIFINVYAIHKDPLLWEDPLVFKPERFLDGRRDFHGNDFIYFPFGSGRRICPGITMAERMVLYSLGSLLYYFDWKMPRGMEKLDLDEKFGITLKKKTPLLLIPSPRSPNLVILSSS